MKEKMQYLTVGKENKLRPADSAFHDWYRFVLSFPPHLVNQYLSRFNIADKSTVLDPFCGTGTTLVECKKRNANAVGVEANSVAYFASVVKCNWTPNPQKLLAQAKAVRKHVLQTFEDEKISDSPSSANFDKVLLRTLSASQEKLLLANSISPLPLHKIITLQEAINNVATPGYRHHLQLAMIKEAVLSASNLRFGPEVGVGAVKSDASVVAPWFKSVLAMVDDLGRFSHSKYPPTEILKSDSRNIAEIQGFKQFDFIFTSPPYPNEKDYTRTTRLESVLLGFLQSKEDLRSLKKGLLRSNTRNIYVGDDDAQYISHMDEIIELVNRIEEKRILLRKTSGFEKLYGTVTRMYFGGMAKHLAQLRTLLKPGAYLAYVVGDQASYFRVMIRTGYLLGKIAEDLGYELVARDLFRERIATATREMLREEVLILRWKS